MTLVDHLLDDGDAVVVRLDDVRPLRATGLDGVGVDRPPAQLEGTEPQ